MADRKWSELTEFTDPTALNLGDFFAYVNDNEGVNYAVAFGTFISFLEPKLTGLYAPGDETTPVLRVLAAGQAVIKNSEETYDLVEIGNSSNNGGYLTLRSSSGGTTGVDLRGYAESTFNYGIQGDLTGNADTATALETPREIGGKTFDGTQDVIIDGLQTPDGAITPVYVDNLGTLHVRDIAQEGESYETHIEQLYTKKDYISLRDGAVAGLGSGEYTGLEAQLYDGVNSGRLVFDKDGVARVGDVGDEQPLLVRDESGDMEASGITFWSDSSQKVTTSPKLRQVDGRITSNGISAYSDGVQAGEDIVIRAVNQFSDTGTSTVIRLINSTSVVSSTGVDLYSTRTDSLGVGTNKFGVRTSNSAANFVTALEVEGGTTTFYGSSKYSSVSNMGNTPEDFASKGYVDSKGVMFSQTSDLTITNTASETSLIGSGVGSTTILANTLTEGSIIEIIDQGYINTPVGQTNTGMRIKINGSTICENLGFDLPDGLVDAHVELYFLLTVRGGTIIGQGRTIIEDTTSAGSVVRSLKMTAPVVFNAGVDNTLDVTYQWGTASADRSVTITNTNIEVK